MIKPTTVYISLTVIKKDNTDQRPSTPTPNNFLPQQQRMANTYEIVKTQDARHVVLVVHEEPPVDTTNAKNETGIIRRFTQDNPVIPYDAFISPVRQFNQENLVIPNDIFHSPISSFNSSEGYCSGSDWNTDSSWRSYDSVRDDLPTLFETSIRSISQFILPYQMRQRNEAEDCHSSS